MSDAARASLRSRITDVLIKHDVDDSDTQFRYDDLTPVIEGILAVVQVEIDERGA